MKARIVIGELTLDVDGTPEEVAAVGAMLRPVRVQEWYSTGTFPNACAGVAGRVTWNPHPPAACAAAPFSGYWFTIRQ